MFNLILRQKIISKKNLLYLSAFIFLIIAILLAIIPLHEQLFFYYDQARDAFSAYNIWHNFHLPILGPTSDIPGLFHGALWYYFLAIPYALGNNSPYFTGYFLLTLFFLSIPLCGYLAYKLFDNLNIALISVILYVFSPLFQISSRWISNPSLSLLIIPFLLIFLWRYINGQNNKNVILLGISFGLLIQSNLAYILFLLLLPIYFFIFKLKFKIVNFTLFTASVLLTLSSFIVAELKFHWRGVLALIDYLQFSHSSSNALANFLEVSLNKFTELLSMSILPFSPIIIYFFILVGFLLLLKTKSLDSLKDKKKPIIFLTIWILNIVFFEFFNVGISRSIHVFLPSLLPLIVLGSYLLYIAISQETIVFIIVIILVLFQINLNLSWVKTTTSPLAVQKGITYSNELRIVDYTYKASEGKNFTVNSITVPLYINTTWAYLYQFYGKSKYKYLPYWDGRDQRGYLGNLPFTSNPTDIRYLIIEPTIGISDFFVTEAINAENVKSTIIKRVKIGNFVVEKRKLKSSKVKR